MKMSSFTAIFSFLGGMMCVCSSMAEEDAASVSTTYGVNDFKPLFKLRDDLKCWPSRITEKSGNCVSKSAFENNKSNTPVYYEELVTEPDPITGIHGRLITYWIYYSKQSACADIPTLGKQGEHPDDWERITVHVQEDKLRHVSYAQHNGIYTRDARDVELTSDGRHAIVYVGKYSHGSYHDQRKKCTCYPVVCNTCWKDGNYCMYYKDPRGPGVDWWPELKSIDELPKDQDFPGSTNPHQRERPHLSKVCKLKAGKEASWNGIKLADTSNTCLKNPGGLRDERNTLKDMALLDRKYFETPAYGKSRVRESNYIFNDKYKWYWGNNVVGLSRVAVRVAKRIDRIEFTTLTSKNESYTYKHGGDGGSYKYFDLSPGEYLTEVTVRTVTHDGKKRIGGLMFKTTKGGSRHYGASINDDSFVVKARTGYHFVGTHGYAVSELDTIGFIETPMPTTNYPSLRGNQVDTYES